MFLGFTPRTWRAALMMAALAPQAQAEYYNFNTESGSDILYQEVRYPYWPESTYNARYYNDILDDAGKSVFFYSGTTFTPTESGITTPRANGYIWSFWPVANPANPGDAVVPSAWNPPFYDVPSIGEGASGKVETTNSLNMATNVWYPSAMRVWRPTGNPPNTARVGQWLKDGATGRWNHIATMTVPFAGTKFSGNLSGFLEDYSHGNRNPRRAEFRNIYYRKNSWKAATTFRPSTRQSTEKGSSGTMENGTVGFFETCSGDSYTGNMGPGAMEMTYTLATPPTPSFDALVVNDVSARVASGQVHVKWTVPDTSAPQFAWKVEIFASPDTSGTPAATFSTIDPDVSECLVPAGGITNPTVRLTLTDIFDKTSTPVVMAAATPVLADASSAASTVPGLNYQYFETTRTTLPEDFSALTNPALQGSVNFPDLTVRRRHTSYVCQFTGYVKIPQDGLWMFAMGSCDGSKLLIDGVPVIDNDGIHSGGSERTVTLALKAGEHPVEVQYFKGSSNTGDNDQLRLLWQGPGVARSPMDEACWTRTATASEPVVTLTSPAAGATVESDQATLTAEVAANGATLNSVRYFNRDTIYANQSGATSPISTTALLGAGANHLKARLMATRGGTSYSFDSPPVDVTVHQRDTAPWSYSALGVRAFQSAAAYQDGTWSMIGDQFNFVWQEISGDETIVTRVAGKPATGTANSSQFDAVAFDGSWSGGVMFRENLSPNPGMEFGNRFVCLYKQLNNGVYLQSSDNVNAGGYVTGANLGSSFTWLKLQRAGTTFTASGSTDGTTWTELGTRTMATPFGQKMYVGLFTLARPSTNPNPHWFKFDNTRFVSAGADFAISAPPQSRTVYAGARVSFSATVTSNTPLTYQWQRGGVDIPGATAATLTLDSAGLDDAGSYRVVISNGSLTQTSGAATLTVNPSGTGYQRAVQILGPYAHWRLGETSGTFTDAIGGFHGTVAGSISRGQAGPRPPDFPVFEATNNGCTISTTGSRIETPALNLNSNTVTLTAWIKRNGNQSSFSGIVFSRAGGTTAGLTFGDANELRYTWNGSGSTYNWNSGLIPPDGKWTFVALVVQPDRAIIAMDPGTGLVSATNAISHAIEKFDGKLLIGQDTNSSSRTFRGTLDEVAVFNRALDASELASLAVPPAAITVTASVPTAKEAGPVNGQFTLTRTLAATSQDLAVHLATSGTATADTDYTGLPATVVIPAGSAATTLAIAPLADTLAEGPETVRLALAPGTGYYAATPAAAIVTIEDLPIDHWRFSAFGDDANTAAIAGDLADPDHDGLANLMEYALNLDPAKSGPPSQPAVVAADGSLSLVYRKNLAAGDLAYSIVGSDDGSVWTTAEATEQVLSDDGATRVIKATVPTHGAARKFLRLKVVRP